MLGKTFELEKVYEMLIRNVLVIVRKVLWCKKSRKKSWG